jgi:putative ABC transport system substrate-binding protein
MDRRTFARYAALLLAAAPASAFGQATARPRRIGLLTAEDLPTIQRDSFRMAFAGRGWVEGVNLHVETRSASGDAARLRPLAEELVRLEVALIIAVGTVASLAAKAATKQIPVVAYGAGDPVGSGLVQSLARPGGNVTGNMVSTNELAAKRVEVMRELFPAGTRIGIPVNPANPTSVKMRAAEVSAGREAGLQILHVEVTKEMDVEAAVAELARRGARTLIINSDPLFSAPGNSLRMMSAVRRAGLTAMIDGTGDAEPILVKFGLAWDEVDGQLARLVDRILNGASPATLAVEQPTRFRLSINLQVARKHGITVPESLLLRADEVFR